MKIADLFIFAAGAAVGSVVTWKLLRTKYEQIAQEEIDSVKEVYARRFEEDSEDAEDEEESDGSTTADYRNKPSLSEYAAKLNNLNYVSEEGSEDMSKDDRIPYVISPDEFGEVGYETASLTYYADGVLTSENDVPIPPEEIEDCVGPDALTSFGQYEEDSVFVRDDSIKMDIEILRDTRTYAELFGEEE